MCEFVPYKIDTDCYDVCLFVCSVVCPLYSRTVPLASKHQRWGANPVLL